MTESLYLMKITLMEVIRKLGVTFIKIFFIDKEINFLQSLKSQKQIELCISRTFTTAPSQRQNENIS